MTYTILFVTTVVVVSGVIAYLGDLLGRRMGKKRLSLFGLRPRYTAIVMTTITGMLIAMATISTLLAVSSSLRQVFFRAEQLVRDNAKYQGLNRDLRAQNGRLVSARDRLSREVEQKAEQVKAARRDAVAALKQRDAATARVSALEREITTQVASLRSLKASSKVSTLRLRDVSARLSDRIEELADRKRELRERDEELVVRQRDLEQKSGELLSKVAALTKAEQDIDAARAAIGEYERTIEEQRGKLIETTEMLLTGEVVLPQGQELSRRVIDASSAPGRARLALTELLDTAGKEARLSGAGTDDGSRAVRLVFEDAATGTRLEDESACIDAALLAIEQQGREKPGRSVLARIVVANNTLKGKNAPAVLNLYWNNLAFVRGERIASRTVDGTQSEGRALLAVMDMLREDVRDSAEKKGVVPVSGKDPERAGQPISEEQFDRVMELVRVIRGQNRQVVVKAIAREDIYQAGPLTLDSMEFAIASPTHAAR